MDDADLAATFLDIGAEYERHRPGFPEEIAGAVAPSRVSCALDLGAGTGTFTERLVDRAGRVFAVDPSEQMLAVLRAKLPSVNARVGAAESIPLADGSCDLVTVAQAYHWFDPDASAREILRVLTPRGRLALIWNAPDPRCAWDASAHRIVHPPLESDPNDDGFLPSIDVPGFVQVSTVRVTWNESITRTGYLQRWMTASTLLAAGESGRTELIREIEDVLDADRETRGKTALRLPHVTDALLYAADR